MGHATPSRPRSDRVQRRKERTRERIFTEAMRLFTEQGFEATTVAQISEAADIGKGTFFTYFATKQDVFYYLGEQVLQTVLERDDPALPAGDRLRRALGSAADWFENHEPEARQMALARLSALPAQSSSPNRRRARELLAEILREGMQAGELRSVPEDDAVLAVASAHFVPVAIWALGPQGPPLRERMHAQLEIVLAGLAARP